MFGAERLCFGSTVLLDEYFTGCDSQDSQSYVVGDLSVLGCYTLSTCKLLRAFLSIAEYYIPQDFNLLVPLFIGLHIACLK